MKGIFTGLACLVAAAALAATAQAGDGKQWSGHRITVETRNLFIGFDAAAALGGAITTGQAWNDLVASNPAARAEKWADEIAENRPDVVGLQEVELITTGPFLNPAPAVTVAFDFLDLLLDALAARGLTYVPAAIVENLYSEVPVFPQPVPFDAGVRDRDVLLVRASKQTGNLKVLAADDANFGAVLVFSGVPLTRGWTSVDLKLHGRTVRIVNTHLEPFFEPVKLAQAAELLAGPGAAPVPTILVGDFNSGPPAPTAAYGLLTVAYDDVWTEVGVGAGLTCCHDDLTAAIPYNERIDLVLVSDEITPLSAHVIGDVPLATFPNFPSDHAGVVATLALP